MATSMDFLSNSIFIPLFLLLLVYIYHQSQKYGKKTKTYHPFGGTKFNQLINYRTLHDYNTNLATIYKTYRVFNPFRGEIYTSDPSIVEYILKTNFKNYGKGAHINNILKDLLGDGILTVDGNEWREQRKVSSHEFSTKVLRDFSSVVFRKNTIKVGNILSEAANSNEKIDITDLFMKATTDSIFKVGFGIDVDNISGSSEEGIRFSRAFDDASALILRRLFDMSWKMKKALNIGTEAELQKNIKVIDDYFKKEDILSRFLQIKNTDPKYIRDIVVAFVLAGKDPIATTLYWFIYMLCKHPHIQDKVAKEIKEATNINMKELEITNVAEFAACVSEEALDKMQYLHANLTETLRLYPALSMDVKICFSDDVLPDGCNVEKGDMVFYLPYAMGRMKSIWGEDAHEFRPERWLDRDGCFHPESPFKFTAFQAGPRICLGRDFAYRQMKIFSSILLGCFVFKLSDENKIPKYKTTINLQIDGPMHICVSKRYGNIYGFSLKSNLDSNNHTSISTILLVYICNQPQKYGNTKKYHPIGRTKYNQLNIKHIEYSTLFMVRFIHDPAIVEYILKTYVKNYGKGVHMHNILKDLFSDGIFTVDGDEW
ncbi:cytochrome P450 [Cynara cardunculus var. scolymus]|uniref:Cytochrome P450 n=1 Tax=Cynara cardunculus var. scolymus TaxID=59895 RepID=A0A124SHY0_CYNCS|nr:cytochrome P450 [Cynara cardunculus var. scolymus]